MRWYGEQVMQCVRQAGRQELERQADRILAVSQQEYVPLNKDPRMAWHKGTLQRSGTVELDPNSNVVGVTIKYSVDEPYDYAALQHEVEDFQHDPPGQPFYLKRPFTRMKADAMARVGDRILLALRGRL